MRPLLSNYEREFLRALHEEKARFLIVGGRAVRLYCPSRQTTDLDLLVGYDGENLASTMAAMGRVDPRYFRRKLAEGAARPGIQAPVDTQGNHADVLTSIPGVDFEEAWAARRTLTDQGIEIHFMSIEHLIANKQAQADDKAHADLALLQSTEMGQA